MKKLQNTMVCLQQLDLFTLELLSSKRWEKLQTSLEDHTFSKNGLSIKSFISGLSYNRFKRMHATMVASFEVLHFERFLEKQEDVEEIIDIIKLQDKDIE